MSYSGDDEFHFSIEIPEDDYGMVARECTDAHCSPGYFKVKLGTGILEDHNEAFCPYCHKSSDPSDYLTEAQLEYARSIAIQKVQKDLDKIIKKSFGLGTSGRKKYGGGLLSVELKYKPSRLNPIPRLYEEELRRNLVCPSCTLEHSVFGLASWCPDCGEDIFLIHVQEEFDVIKKIIGEVDNRRKLLGARIAAKDIENSLEDTVSIFEAVLKHLTKRKLIELGKDETEINQILSNKIRNSFQSISRSKEKFKEYFDFSLFDNIDKEEVEFISEAFEKRHPITHNLGVMDKKYLQRVASGELEGRELKLSEDEVLEAINIAYKVLTNADSRAFLEG